MKAHKHNLVQCLLLITMLALAINSSLVMDEIRKSLKICFSGIIPSLFPYMVLSSVFVSSINNNSFRILCNLCKHLFGISPYGTGALICGVICGYPIGPRCACQLYKDKKISASEAQSLIAYSNNCSPLFVIGAIGAGFLGNVKTGLILYCVQVSCAFISAIMLKPFTYSKYCVNTDSSNIKTFTEAICDSSLGIINICGYILFFGAVGAMINPFICNLPVWLKCMIYTLLEITNGIKKISTAIEPPALKLAFISMGLGWCGTAVHMQVKSICDGVGLSMKKYYITKLCVSAFSAIITYIIFGGKDILIPFVHSFFLRVIVFTILLGAILLYIQKKRGNPLFSKKLV